MKDLTDKTIGRYQIKELIGEGAMAKVYRAYDPDINRSLALKVLKSDFSGDEEHLSRFVQEAKAAGALSHNNIVTVYDVGEVENSPYMMMELLDGDDLGEMLTKRRTFSVEDTLVIALQLAKALNYAHQAGIVHRDIKPDNIMVLDDDVSIKVADFGIARMNENEDAQKTQVGAVLGTPRYMSPEQALGQDVDGRTDLYSVGVILYEMLTGEKAFDAANIGTLMTQIIHQQPTSLKQAHPELPSGLCHIVQKLLHKKPEKRFQTGAELATAISKELTVFSEQQETQKKNKYIPLKVRWTVYMSAIVAFFMVISVSIVFNIQTKAMSGQAIDSGSAFAKFVAIETAVPLLSEDWITLESFINEAAGRKTFSYLIVTDREGIVRGASDTSLVGQTYESVEPNESMVEKDGVQTTSLELANGDMVFDIEAPILFQDIVVGKIILGLSQKSLTAVKSVTGWLMFVLALVTTIAVSVVLYIFGALITRPLRLLNNSMKQIESGEMDTRISLTRKDELGEMFETFNTMAASLQQKLNPDDEISVDLEASGLNIQEASEASVKINLDNPNEDCDKTVILAEKVEVEGESIDGENVESDISDDELDKTVVITRKPDEDSSTIDEENVEPDISDDELDKTVVITRKPDEDSSTIDEESVEPDISDDELDKTVVITRKPDEDDSAINEESVEPDISDDELDKTVVITRKPDENGSDVEEESTNTDLSDDQLDKTVVLTTETDEDNTTVDEENTEQALSDDEESTELSASEAEVDKTQSC